MNDIWVPGWLYKAWPWLCLSMVIGYGIIGQWSISAFLSVYLFFIVSSRI